MRVLQGEGKAKDGLVLSHNLKYVLVRMLSCIVLHDHIVVYHTVHYLAYLVPVQNTQLFSLCKH